VARVVLPASVVCVYLGIVFLIGTPGGWQDLGVPGEKPSFLDLRSVTTAWDCERRGIDVLPRNPCDPQQRPANYPRIWLLPRWLGLGESATVPIGIAMAVVFLATAISLAPRDGSLLRVAAYSAFLCTPGIMLGVERGNVDILLVCLVALAVRLFQQPARRVVGALLILVAAILKLFPIFATPLLLRQPRRDAAMMISGVLASFAVYVGATFGDIRTILHAVPKSGSYSYGLDILGHAVSRVIGVGDRFVWDGILAVAAVAAAFVLSRYIVSATAPAFELDALVAGASVFALSYVFFRSFDYRLAFLLLALPLLLRRAENRQLDAWATLAALLGALCLESRRVLPAGVLAQYALFILLLALLIREFAGRSFRAGLPVPAARARRPLPTTERPRR
jgi:Glycosyltransferase family 87